MRLVGVVLLGVPRKLLTPIEVTLLVAVYFDGHEIARGRILVLHLNPNAFLVAIQKLVVVN